MRTVERQSPAKINLTLRVVGKRDDGFHEIESLIARIDLCDTVNVSPRDDGRLTLECDEPSIPADESNLALKAAAILRDKAATPRGAHISLKKRIPAGAGLGGGSSNAATTLALLNELWNLDFPNSELAAMGAEIGSDVPLFFHSPLCVVRGRGELIEDIDLRLSGWVVLLIPQIPCATGAVYAAWKRLPEHPQRPAIDAVVAQVNSARTVSELSSHLFNDLAPAACAAVPEFADWSRQVGLCAGGLIHMTGSGSALYRLFDHEAEARRFARDHSITSITSITRTVVCRFASD